MVESKPLLLASAALIGIFLISLASEYVDLGFTDLKELDMDMRNQAVHVRGVVKEFKEFRGGARLLIEQDGFKSTVIYFGEIVSRKGMCADVVGEVKIENGELKIMANEVKTFLC